MLRNLDYFGGQAGMLVGGKYKFRTLPGFGYSLLLTLATVLTSIIQVSDYFDLSNPAVQYLNAIYKTPTPQKYYLGRQGVMLYWFLQNYEQGHLKFEETKEYITIRAYLQIQENQKVRF